jgi:LDH2 family malate/lactate/ureidoglycolate dehydrogenase
MYLEEFKERKAHLYSSVVESERMDGVDKIYFPGEIEQMVQEEREKTGIPFDEAEITALNAEAEKAGSEKLKIQ